MINIMIKQSSVLKNRTNNFRFGEVDKMEFLTTKDSPAGVTAVVSFLSLQIAAKIYKMTHKISNNALTTRYHDFSSSTQSDSKSEIKEKRTRNEDFQRYESEVVIFWIQRFSYFKLTSQAASSPIQQFIES